MCNWIKTWDENKTIDLETYTFSKEKELHREIGRKRDSWTNIPILWSLRINWVLTLIGIHGIMPAPINSTWQYQGKVSCAIIFIFLKNLRKPEMIIRYWIRN